LGGRGYIGSKTRRIDARGLTVVPGFTDCHVHMRNFGDSLQILDLRLAGSIGEVAVKVQAAARELPTGEWIRGRSWDQTRWPGGAFPSSDELSRAAPNHPVYLTRVDGHAAWVNRKALDLADVNAGTQDPPGGRILRDASGRPTGVLIDRAMGLVSRRIPPVGAERTKSNIARAAAECARLGLTTVHDAGAGAEDLAGYRALIAGKQLPVRVYAMIRGEGALWSEYLKRGPEVGERLTVRSIKLVADGALGSRGAAMMEPYSDEPGNKGLAILSRADVERVARAAAGAGLQVNTHAIGDAGNRAVLDAYAAALGGRNDRRFRVEHAQVVALEDIPRFAQYSIIASMQATHATSDMRWAEARVGPKRVLGAYAWQRFLKIGVPVANGSDFPVESADPLWGFYAAVTRRDHDGNPEGGWQPDQKMSREEALHSWTLAGAFAAFEEKKTGSLEPGKAADFVVLTQDIMQIPAAQILKAKVALTVLGGEIVYNAMAGRARANPPRLLSPARRAVVVVTALGFFAGVCLWSGRRLWRATRRTRF
ncbi:MAG: amidohydrolase, partial [Bryobacteraceae bacterium]